MKSTPVKKVRMILKSFSKCIVRFVCPLICLAPFLAAAQTYVPPAPGRESVNLNPNWRFIRQDVAGAQAAGFDDSVWSVVNLPHTWNNLDGQDGGNNYYRGIGWYRTHLTPASTNAGKQFFLKFNGAALVTDVWVNGAFVGQHQGGFAAFVFDVTPHLVIGADNVIAVKVNNAVNSSIPPASGDFTVFGGLYRDVQLLLTDRVQISPLDYGSPGVYLMPTNVSAASANLQVTTVLSNASPTLTNVMVRTVITDAQTNTVATLTNLVTLPATSGSNVVAHTVIANPRLWNGRYDPYVYRAFVEVWKGGAVVDLVTQPLGFRFFHVDPTNGFFLNGAHYDLHGVNFHQDWLNRGWALTNTQRETNLALIEEVGATIVRVAHYQHDDYTYTLADSKGLVVWAEVPYIGAAPTTSANLLQQLRELIRQNFNHPSIVCWGLYNEIQPGNQPTVDDEVAVAVAEDPTRFNTAASNRGDGDVTTFKTQTICWNKYFGWYNSPINGIAAWADNIHATYPTRAVGVGEYGAGGSIYQHSEDPVPQPAPNSGPHPQEWQNLVHETNWLVLRDRPFLWAKIFGTCLISRWTAATKATRPGAMTRAPLPLAFGRHIPGSAMGCSVPLTCIIRNQPLP
ncbi:MAG: beta galactosidase jelly roll domain-containing protein [Akkermansiaceae bacterium]|nr:beta galactosidase jelly roll domain-containing protein [Verrucomicrobiales bacterium]